MTRKHWCSSAVVYKVAHFCCCCLPLPSVAFLVDLRGVNVARYYTKGEGRPKVTGRFESVAGKFACCLEISMVASMSCST